MSLVLIDHICKLVCRSHSVVINAFMNIATCDIQVLRCLDESVCSMLLVNRQCILALGSGATLSYPDTPHLWREHFAHYDRGLLSGEKTVSARESTRPSHRACVRFIVEAGVWSERGMRRLVVVDSLVVERAFSRAFTLHHGEGVVEIF